MKQNKELLIILNDDELLSSPNINKNNEILKLK